MVAVRPSLRITRGGLVAAWLEIHDVAQQLRWGSVHGRAQDNRKSVSKQQQQQQQQKQQQLLRRTVLWELVQYTFVGDVCDADQPSQEQGHTKHCATRGHRVPHCDNSIKRGKLSDGTPLQKTRKASEPEEPSAGTKNGYSRPAGYAMRVSHLSWKVRRNRSASSSSSNFAT